MRIDEFEQFFQNEVKACHDIMLAKNADYSAGDDKLANFKLAGNMENCSPEVALDMMDLKHRVSIAQGMIDLAENERRPLKWWQEKIRDHINYQFLLLALLTEKDTEKDEEIV